MNEKTEKLEKTLEETIAEQFAMVKALPEGGEERTAAIKNLSVLYNLKNEDVKMVLEEKAKLVLERSEKKNRIVKIGTSILDAATRLLPLVLYYKLTQEGWHREFDDGDYTTSESTKTIKGMLFRQK